MFAPDINWLPKFFHL